jgi:hypothetical protein
VYDVPAGGNYHDLSFCGDRYMLFWLGTAIRPAAAGPIASCNASFTVYGIPENTLLQLPFVAIAGDAIVTDPGGAVVSDVFRIFNNIVNTGAGTGLGNMVFLYSSDDTTLPNPCV